MKRFKSKMALQIEQVKEEYEKLLKTTLRASKRAYLMGKLEIYKRVSEKAFYYKNDIKSNYASFFMGKCFADVAKREILMKELIDQNPVGRINIKSLNKIQDELLVKRQSMERGEQDPLESEVVKCSVLKKTQ